MDILKKNKYCDGYTYKLRCLLQIVRLQSAQKHQKSATKCFSVSNKYLLNYHLYIFTLTPKIHPIMIRLTTVKFATATDVRKTYPYSYGQMPRDPQSTRMRMHEVRITYKKLNSIGTLSHSNQCIRILVILFIAVTN